MEVSLPFSCLACPCDCGISKRARKVGARIGTQFCKAKLFDYLVEKSKPAPDQKEIATKIAFLKSRLQSESGEDAAETKKEIEYYESGDYLPKEPR